MMKTLSMRHALRLPTHQVWRTHHRGVRGYATKIESDSKVVIVTGANRGIGKAICELILQDKSITPVTVYATSRNPNNLDFTSSSSPSKNIVPSHLDISSPTSIAAFAKTLGTRPVDVLINNAGVNLDSRFSLANATSTLATNYRGTLSMCETILPLMRKRNARIVNMSSVGSSLKTWSPELAQTVRSIDTLPDLDKLVLNYLEHVGAGTDTQAGFPHQRSYSVSKAAVNLLTKILAAQHPDVTINCCCPGWIDTSMGALIGGGKRTPPKTAEQGAVIPLRLAFGDVGGVSGRYWANESVRSKEDGEVQDW